MIQTHGLMRMISRIADMELKAYPQSETRIDFSTREANVDLEIHRDGVHGPSLEIGLSHNAATHRIIVPRALQARLPMDWTAMSSMLRMIEGSCSIRSDPTSSSLRRRYESAMRFASLFHDGIAAGGGRAALDLVAATPVSGVRVRAQNGYRVDHDALRLVSDFIPHGRTTRIQFQAVRGMTLTWEVCGLQTPIGIVEPVGAMERLRMTAELLHEFASDGERLDLIRRACAGAGDGDAPGRRAA